MNRLNIHVLTFISHLLRLIANLQNFNKKKHSLITQYILIKKAYNIMISTLYFQYILKSI
jgi:hypothetical protein